ncbi:carbohydrate-binding module family 5 protein [Hydnum rufescens UP504]|uniref:chitinase n=1 Tax=Hydnum rufescens UP504 TaxID=1448309 RepID=A0A9P6B823_9AGAM|nr:carbohydrate-binding module family 5 protein [Hydnum rufescens UP504]
MVSRRSISPILALVGASILSGATAVFDETCNSNVVAYWGQNSYGTANSANTADFQQRLSYYCRDDSVDIIPISFLDIFTGVGNLPQINLANTCNTGSQTMFAGSQLLNCSFLADDIKTCQSNGKIVTLSLGGAAGGGAADSAFADQVWNLFLGGSSTTRPFGDAVLDGVDLDIEGGSDSYVTFVNQLRSHFSTDTSKKYYISAAPQCPYPDVFIGPSLNGAKFDMVYIQFYNNPCGMSEYSSGDFNFGTWDAWASTLSPNPDIKLYIGVPASTSAAGSGYVDATTLAKIASETMVAFPHFGGIMYWDASQAWANNDFQQSVRSTLKTYGSCGQQFTYPECSAPAWTASENYPGGSQVSYQNYIWQTKYFGSGTPVPSDTGSWVPVSACGDPVGSTGGSPPPPAFPIPPVSPPVSPLSRPLFRP